MDRLDDCDYDQDQDNDNALHPRSYRTPMLLVACAMGIVSVMALSPGTRHSVLWHVGLATAPPDDAGLVPLVSPVYGFTTVEVLLGKEADLVVDGKSVGNARRQSLQLAPGQHVLVAQQGGQVLTEKFTAPANESLRVEFQTHNVRVFREITATP